MCLISPYHGKLEGWYSGIHDAEPFYVTDPKGFFVGIFEANPWQVSLRYPGLSLSPHIPLNSPVAFIVDSRVLSMPFSVLSEEFLKFLDLFIDIFFCNDARYGT